MNRPIIISSVERSGSSWLGKILDSSPHTLYKFEPFHPEFGIIKDLSTIIPPDGKKNNKRFIKAIEDLLDFNSKWVDKKPRFPKSYKHNKEARLVLKTVRSSFRLKWISNVLGKPKLIYIIRNPFGYINSIKTVATKKSFPEFGELNKFQNIKNDMYFGQYFNKFMSEYFEQENIIFRETLYWKLRVGTMLNEFGNDDNFKVIVYEDLCSDPLKVTKDVFDFLELEMTNQTKNFIKESTVISKASSPYSVYQNPKNSMNKWKAELNDTEKKAVETALSRIKLMKYWENQEDKNKKFASAKDLVFRPYYLTKYYFKRLKAKLLAKE